MKKTRDILMRVFSLYKLHVAIMLPLLLLTMIGLFIDRIPYLNLYKDIVILIVLILDWMAVLWLSRISRRTMFLIAFFFLILTFPLHYMGFLWYVETLSNFAYVILSIALFLEIRSFGVLQHESKKKKNL
jgi:hypothetical protein